MFRNEHDAAGQSIEAVAWHGVEAVAALCAKYFHYAVVVVAAGGVDGHAGGLVDHDDVDVFVDYADWFACYGRLVAVQGVGDQVAVLDLVGC